MDLNKIKKIHFIGLGGIGVSAIAKMMLYYGKRVSGSDLIDSEIIRNLVREGVNFFLGHRAKNLTADVDLVVYSPAVPENNPERQKANKLKIPQFSYPEFLGELSKEKFTIAVSGTNGKSTTTALLGLILEAAGLDPTVIVGSQVPQWHGNLRISERGSSRIKTWIDADTQRRSTQIPTQINADNLCQSEFDLSESEYLVVEACEWQAHMLNLWPKIIVLTNLELDHLDYYRDLNHIIETFQRYVEKLSPIDLLIINADDPNLKKLKPKCRVITYGIRNQADIMVKNIKVGSGFQKFDLCLPRERRIYPLEKTSGKTKGFYQICNLKLRVPGLFNIYNVLAASAAALSLGVEPKIIKKTLENFKGIWRRFELINADTLRGSKQIKTRINADIRVNPRSNPRESAIFISDYAHHPTAIRGTIQAAREFFPKRRIVAVFQPHHRNRTKKLFRDFVKSFDQADLVIISEIFNVAGRESREDSRISSKDLVKAVIRYQKTIPLIRANKRNKKRVVYAADLKETKKMILANLQSNDLVLVMGAGDIYQIVEDLVNKK